MSGDSRRCELMVRPHTSDQTDVHSYVVRTVLRSVFDAPGAKVTLPPTGRASFAQTHRWERCDIQSCYTERREKQKGSIRWRLLHSLYKEHAVRFLLFLWCKTAPVSGFDLKDNWKRGLSPGPVKTKQHGWVERGNMWDSEHFYPTPPEIRNRPPACTSRGMILF